MITIYYGILKKERKVKEVVKTEEKKTIQLDDEGLKVFVSNIEDKSKAINAAIGRVYSVKHGGTESLRKKIKIDASDYNEFSELKNETLEKRRRLAIELLRKIKDKLDLLLKFEKEVFDKSEINHLSIIERLSGGEEKVLDVLIKNDKDPVQSYYHGAVIFCDDALDILITEELEYLKKKSEEKKKKQEEESKVQETSVTKETRIS
jgi:hypothetical protein